MCEWKNTCKNIYIGTWKQEQRLSYQADNYETYTANLSNAKETFLITKYKKLMRPCL